MKRATRPSITLHTAACDADEGCEVRLGVSVTLGFYQHFYGTGVFLLRLEMFCLFYALAAFDVKSPQLQDLKQINELRRPMMNP